MAKETSTELIEIAKAKKLIRIVLIAMALIGVFEGFLISTLINKIKLLTPTILAFFPLMYYLNKFADRQIEKLEREKLNYSKGALGEHLVSKELEKMPNNYHMVNDLTTPYGNIDHVVIGPTGIFLIDTKSWKGTITSDKSGEVLINGKPTDKPHIRNFQNRVMQIRKRFLSLCNIEDIYFQPVFVFTNARVEAKWGKTKNVFCMTVEKLNEFIENQKQSDQINQSMITQYVDAFESLKKFDKIIN